MANSRLSTQPLCFNKHTVQAKKYSPTIFISDLIQIYQNPCLDPEYNVRTLQNKVMFDIRFYFSRKGGENMMGMTKDTFKLMTDADTGLTYIRKVKDE